MPRHSPPREEDAQRLASQICCHADQISTEANLRLANLRDRMAEIVVRSHAKDLNSFPCCDGSQFLTSRSGPIERISVRSFAVDFHPIIAEFASGFDQFGKAQRFPAVPES